MDTLKSQVPLWGIPRGARAPSVPVAVRWDTGDSQGGVGPHEDHHAGGPLSPSQLPGWRRERRRRWGGGGVLPQPFSPFPRL